MLLATDAGNTNTTFCIFDKKRILKKWKVYTNRSRTTDEYELLLTQLLNQSNIRKDQITGIIISSVVPNVLFQLKEMSLQSFHIDPIVVSADLEIGMNILYDDPRSLGADRIANAIGGYTEYGGPLIVVDFGTATNFDVISEAGDFLGGAIAPGIGISMEALLERTALLPKIDISIAPKAIGKNTVSGMQSGCYFGFLGQVEEIIRRIKLELNGEPKVVATGGSAEPIARNSKFIGFIDPDLTLKGLQVIYERVCCP